MAGIDGDSTYCKDCTNPRDVDCQYCYKGSKHEVMVTYVRYSPTFTVGRRVIKGYKKDQLLLPFISK